MSQQFWLGGPQGGPSSQWCYEYKPLISPNPSRLSFATADGRWHALKSGAGGAGVHACAHPGIRPRAAECFSTGYWLTRSPGRGKTETPAQTGPPAGYCPQILLNPSRFPHIFTPKTLPKLECPPLSDNPTKSSSAGPAAATSLQRWPNTDIGYFGTIGGTIHWSYTTSGQGPKEEVGGRAHTHTHTNTRSRQQATETCSTTRPDKSCEPSDATSQRTS